MTGGALGGLANAGPSGVDGLLDREVNNYQEKAELEEEQRKKESKKKTRAINDEIDNELEKANLMSQLQDMDGDFAARFEDDQRKQDEKAAERRRLLLARRKNKKKHELGEERVKDKVKLLEEEHQEKEKISEEYIRNMFKRQPGHGEPTPQETERKLQLLNEYLKLWDVSW